MLLPTLGVTPRAIVGCHMSLRSRSDCLFSLLSVERDEPDETSCRRRMFFSYAEHLALLAAVSAEVNSAIPSLSCCEARSPCI